MEITPFTSLWNVTVVASLEANLMQITSYRQHAKVLRIVLAHSFGCSVECRIPLVATVVVIVMKALANFHPI